MNEQRTRYPGYDVLKEQDEWDPHTREIVLKRLGPFPEPEFLSENEVEMIKAIAGHLVYDNREEIMAFVVHNLDQNLASDIGESERKPEQPEQKNLIRWGLRYIESLAQTEYKSKFLELDEEKQFQIIAALQTGKAPQLPEWSRVPQKELFKKLVTEVVGAYYSHPQVWSEIGYGGPAYPRGYVRVEHGLTDPWEAKRDVGES
ncbi:gluconate 2-dehydrogenase subunit 3 family protein [Desulfolucanica intricata]|uniref:gluconate 2-dehydrogenase subunit 3 family protein n=1 Tax=Desulfolucanica intricata TaxID=1285191 RepID=UPI00082A1383|nr:gluconate 2-dehydrogenase subunit 3 family protein [Desulfolucanica intricata]